MKKQPDDLFKFLNWILKKQKSNYPEDNPPSAFMINRWLSMADPDIARIVNITFNRWLKKTDLNRENHLINKFYHYLLPTKKGKINYIKKEKTNESLNLEDEEKNYSSNLEISEREILIHKQTLEELKQHLK